MSGINDHPDILYYITDSNPININSIPADSYLFDDGILDGVPFLIETNMDSSTIHYTTVRDYLAYKHYRLFNNYSVYEVNVSSYSDIDIYRSGRETDREYITTINIPKDKMKYLGILHNQLTRQKTDINSNIPIQNIPRQKLPQGGGSIITNIPPMSNENLSAIYENKDFKAIIGKRFYYLDPD